MHRRNPNALNFGVDGQGAQSASGWARGIAWLAAALALALVLAVTHRHGLGVSLDSVVYAGAAASLLERGALEVPLTRWDSDKSYAPLSHFPPALPVTLAGVARLLNVDPYAAARWLNAVCILATFLIALLPVADHPLALLTMAALLAGPSFVTMHVWLWSEPLFLLLVVGSVRLAAATRAFGLTARHAMVLGAVCGLATLTRYAGVSLFAGFGIWVLVSRAAPPHTKRRWLLWYSGTYLATILPWLWWLSVRASAPRSLGVYTEHVWSGIVRPLAQTVAGWFVPASLPPPLGLAAAAAALVAVTVVGIRRARAGARFRPGPTAAVAGVVLVIHLLFLVVARLTADPGMPFDERILSAAMMLTVLGLGEVIKTMVPLTPSTLPVVLVLVLALANVMATAGPLVHALRHGNGYASNGWKHSETIGWLRSASTGLTIFSNAPDAICAWLPVTAKYTPTWDEAGRLAEFVARVEQSAPAAVVLFADPHGSWLLPRDRLKDLSGRAGTRELADAVVLAWGVGTIRP